MSIKALQEYTRYSKYSNYRPDLKRRETWKEQIDRVFGMHEEKFKDTLHLFREEFDFAKQMVLKKRVLGSQRALQFGGTPILSKHSRLYNCTSSYCNRPRFFQEAMWLLLSGCGVGFSVQQHHIAKLPKIADRTLGKKVFTPDDSIEGWSDCIGVLMSSFFDSTETPFPEYRGYEIEFNFSNIRPQGSPISWGGKAPGSEPLKRALEKIDVLLRKCIKHSQEYLKPINAYDIVMFASDAVLAGGVRRSATICLFSLEDQEMMTAKTGSWFIDNPQRGRSNNSVVLVRDEITQEKFNEIMVSIKEFGEPGFFLVDNREQLTNPCCEIGLYAYDEDGNSGFEFCNLCEINMKKCKTEQDFYDSCRAASILGTMQASYTTFDYLGETTKKIVEREALLGVSMTGMSDSIEIAFNPEIQKKGAKIVLEVNESLAKKIGINPCARGTCVKPAGTTSCLLGSASGIHRHHSRRYMRNVQANMFEVIAQHFKKVNPSAVEESVWSANKLDWILTFLCEVSEDAGIKKEMSAIQFLESVKLTQENWVEHGTRHSHNLKPWLRHNVSNTTTVNPEEWDSVSKYIFENRKWFAGISLLPMSGDKDYPQAPFIAVYTPEEIIKEYGDASLFASGLIVDGLHAFQNNLWAACDSVLGIGEILDVEALRAKIIKDTETNGENWLKLGLYPNSDDDNLRIYLGRSVKNLQEKRDWIRRAKQFADRYFEGNIRRMTYCLKDVSNWKKWVDLKREYKDVDWTQCVEEENTRKADETGAEACAGGKCDLIRL